MKTLILSLVFVNASFALLCASGEAYTASVCAAISAVRDVEYGETGSAFMDSRNVADDAHYHEDPSRYDGSQDGRPVR
jgi:hypothetical protein